MTTRHHGRASGVPARLRAAREARDLTQGQVAERLRLSADQPSLKRQTISLWEDDERGKGANSERVVLLGRVLQCSPVWLAFGRGKPVWIEDADDWTWVGYGARLRQARGALSQAELGRLLDYGKPTARQAVYQIEAELTRLDLALCESAAGILQVSPSWLAFGREG